ncbi:hypothetical protein DVK02_11795 [Halobellus sp. Atlit-31R]|nr:hypothetical protein DVK02_11795 [Halobellus sp. Atlit-31R]
MTDERADSIPDDPAARRALAEQLATRADERPDTVSREELSRVVALLDSEDAATTVAAAEAIQHLHERPALFGPFVTDLLAASRTYPDDVERIPAPATWMGDDRIRTVVFVADALARVARDRPDLFDAHADELRDLLRSDRNTPYHLLFVLGFVTAADPDSDPEPWLRDALCGLLDRGRGNGYPSWAAETLRRLGDPAALPALREAYPGGPADEQTRRAFDEAITALEDETDA